MDILGQGHKGVVIASSGGSVEKFYKLEAEWKREERNLSFLADIQAQGFSIGCKIPEFLASGTPAEWNIAGNIYHYRSKMERLYGEPANRDFAGKDPDVWGSSLAATIFNLYTRSRPYIEAWIARSGDEDKLLRHVLDEKAARVLQEETDEEVKRHVEEAAGYLEMQVPKRAERRTLCHQDLSPPNVIINQQNRVEGLVDWGSFGLTDPTLSLYQLVARPKIWQPFQKKYKSLGGVIENDILYAASVIHLAWVPLACRELGLAMDEDETREKLQEMYLRFSATRRLSRS